MEWKDKVRLYERIYIAGWVLIVVFLCGWAAYGQTGISGTALKGKGDVNVTVPNITVPVQDLCWREMIFTTKGPQLLFAYTYMPSLGFEWETKFQDKTSIFGVDFDKDKMGWFCFNTTGQRFELGYLAGYFAPVIIAEQWGTSFSVQGEKGKKEISGRDWTLGGGCRAAYQIGDGIWIRGRGLLASGHSLRTSSADLCLSGSVTKWMALSFGIGYRDFRTTLNGLSISLRSHGPMAGMEMRW